MRRSTYKIEHTVTFSECNYFGVAKHYSCMCWLENARFKISEMANIQDFFFREHRSQIKFEKGINDTGECFTMPVLEINIHCFEELPFGTEILIHTWLEKPVAAYLVFHHLITSRDCKTTYLECDTRICLLGEKTGLMKELPPKMYDRIIEFIESIQKDSI